MIPNHHSDKNIIYWVINTIIIIAYALQENFWWFHPNHFDGSVKTRQKAIASFSSFTPICCRDHYVHAPSQWETTLHCNVISHLLQANWSLMWYPNCNSVTENLHACQITAANPNITPFYAFQSQFGNIKFPMNRHGRIAEEYCTK